MKRLNFKKKYVAGALAAGLIMGAGGIAAAYFTATATGTGKVGVGSATPFQVTQNGVSGKLYPGKHVTTSFNIKNIGGGNQHYSAVVAVDHTAAGTIITAFQTAGQTVVTGCTFAWFTPTVTSGGSGTLGSGASSTLSVTVTMTNVATTQNACQTTFPKLTVSSGGPAGFALFEAEGGTASWTNNKLATLSIPAGAPTYKSTATATGAAAGIEVLKPSATLPATAPTFSTGGSAPNQGSPRWVIQFSTGGTAQGTASTLPNWTTHTTTTTPAQYHYGVTWTTVKTEFAGKTVTQAFIVMTTGQTPPATDTIATVTYGGLKF